MSALDEVVRTLRVQAQRRGWSDTDVEHVLALCHDDVTRVLQSVHWVAASMKPEAVLEQLRRHVGEVKSKPMSTNTKAAGDSKYKIPSMRQVVVPAERFRGWLRRWVASGETLVQRTKDRVLGVPPGDTREESALFIAAVEAMERGDTVHLVADDGSIVAAMCYEKSGFVETAA